MIFFLGGYDAEMVEIRKILEKASLRFYDHKLQWGAKLSDYKKKLDTISKDDQPVLIELELDVLYPENTLIIDHHNPVKASGNLSSIEQIANLLNVKLNSWQKLIAINDVAWIDGLIEVGATQEEIENIRAFDRKCQGVNEKSEKEAEEAIMKMDAHGNLAVVEIPHKHASAVIDRLYSKFENILVFSPNETNFSGRGDIVKFLAEQYPDSWFGGNLPIKGFWGIRSKVINIIEILISKLKEV